MECYFFQLWKNNNDEPLINEDSRSNYRICELLRTWGVIEDHKTARVYDAISADYDPEHYAELVAKEEERRANVKEMFDLVGLKEPR